MKLFFVGGKIQKTSLPINGNAKNQKVNSDISRPIVVD